MTPRRIKLSPYTYTVREVRGLQDSGACAPDYEAILVDAEQSDGQKRDTLLHEALHGIIRQGLEQQFKDVDKSFEESVVSFFAPRLLGLLRDNPALVEYLTS